MNGATPVITSYNLDNQSTSGGVSYDLAGSLANDGTAAYTFDALNRLTGRAGTTTNAYNGDGVLVSQVTAGVTTRYTQDLVAPLSQVLQSFTGATRADSLFAMGRIATQTSSVRTWYVADALGSVRRTVSDAGVPQGVISYDPWGTVESGSVPTFGFTGELQQGGDVYLRARWYNAGSGRFGSVDPFAGAPEQPYSLHPYQYAYSAPTTWADPSGRVVSDGGDGGSCTPANLSLTDPRGVTPGDCRVPSAHPQPKQRLVPTQVQPRRLAAPPKPKKAATTGYYYDSCDTPVYSQVAGAPPPRDTGLIEGTTIFQASMLISTAFMGRERVFDLYDFEYGEFDYEGGGLTFGDLVGASTGKYVGVVAGWSSLEYLVDPGVHNYAGASYAVAVGTSLPFGQSTGVQGFITLDHNLYGATVAVGAGLGIEIPYLPGSINFTGADYTMTQRRAFRRRGSHTIDNHPTYHDAIRFVAFIMSLPQEGTLPGARTWAVQTVLENGKRWEEYSGS